MTLTIKRDGNWSSFQLANSALPLSVTSSAIAPSARMLPRGSFCNTFKKVCQLCCSRLFWAIPFLHRCLAAVGCGILLLCYPHTISFCMWLPLCGGESGWCSDVASTHGAWRHAGVRFLLRRGTLSTYPFRKLFFEIKPIDCPLHFNTSLRIKNIKTVAWHAWSFMT